MFDLQPNAFLDAICMALATLLVLYNYKKVLVENNPEKGTGYISLGLFILFFSLYYRPIEGDFWHYLSAYEAGRPKYVDIMEDIYYVLMEYIPNNYLLWRTVIWAPAAVFVVLTFKRLNIESGFSTIFFLCFALTTTFYYTRNCVGLYLLYLGLAVYSSSSKKFDWKSLMFIIAVGYFSYFLHKSIPIYLAVVIMSVIVPLNKRTIYVLLALFPILYTGLMYYASIAVALDVWSDDGSRAELYMEQQVGHSTFFGILSSMIHYVPIMYFLFVGLRDYIIKKGTDALTASKPYKVFLLAGFFLVFISLLMLGQIRVEGRLYKSAMAPLSIAMCYYFKENWKSKECNVFIYLFIFDLLWSMFEIHVLKK